MITPCPSSVVVVARRSLGVVFIVAGAAKLWSYSQFVLDLALLCPGWQTVAAVALIVLELGTGLVLVVRTDLTLGLMLSGALLVLFATTSIVRWDYIAQGCSCFGPLSIGPGAVQHRAVLAAMVALLSLSAIPEVRGVSLRAAVGISMVITLGIYGVLGLGYTRLDSLHVSEIGSLDSAVINLERTTPILVLTWDCPSCRDLVVDIITESSDRPLNVVFTYPEWLDRRLAHDSALLFATNTGLAGRLGVGLYLDHDFRFRTAPVLLVPVRGVDFFRVVVSPSRTVLERLLGRGP